MQRIYHYLLVGFTAGLLILGCAKKDSPVGIDLVDDNTDDTFPQEVILSPTSVDTFFADERALGNGTNLLVGGHHDFIARSIMRFSFLDLIQDSTFADTFFVDADSVSYQALLQLVLNDVFPRPDNAPDQTIELYPLTQEWQEYLTTWTVLDTTDSLEYWEMAGGTYDTAGWRAQTVVGNTADTSYVEVQFDITEWMLDTSNPPTDTTGLLLKLPDDDEAAAEYVRHFFSRESGTPPEIKLHKYMPGDTVTYTFNCLGDAVLLSIPDNLDYTNQEIMRVRNGYRERALFKFDLPDSLDDTTINLAQLTLHIDPDNSAYIENLMTINLYALASEVLSDSALTDPNWSPDSILNYTVILASKQMTDDTEILMEGLNLNYAIQEIISGERENYGFMLRGSAESSTIEYVSFFTNEAPSGLKPSLRLIYTRPRDSVFSDSTDPLAKTPGGAQ